MAKNVSPRRKLSRQEKRNLDIEIEFLEGLVKRAPDYIDALLVLGDDYTRRGCFLEGLHVDEQLVRLRPCDSLVHYNLACSYSLTDQIDQALLALEKALNLGYRDFKWMNEDPDLAVLRQHPGYKQIQAKARSLKVQVH
jgi:tetratricopeptide (TPR) repeat protein